MAMIKTRDFGKRGSERPAGRSLGTRKQFIRAICIPCFWRISNISFLSDTTLLWCWTYILFPNRKISRYNENNRIRIFIWLTGSKTSKYIHFVIKLKCFSKLFIKITLYFIIFEIMSNYSPTIILCFKFYNIVCAHVSRVYNIPL